jgi:hypothetical protein
MKQVHERIVEKGRTILAEVWNQEVAEFWNQEIAEVWNQEIVEF